MSARLGATSTWSIRWTLVLVGVSLAAPAAAQDVRLGNDVTIGLPAMRGTTPRDRTDPVCVEAGERLGRPDALVDRTSTARLPPIAGEPTQARLERWSRRRLAPYLGRAMDDLAALDELTRRTVALGCPLASVAALATHGAAYERLYLAIGAVPRPTDVDPEQWAVYESSTDRMGAPLRQVAIASYEAGLFLARSERLFGEASERCAEGLIRLGALAPSEELVGVTGWSESAVPPPLPSPGS